MRKPSKPTDQHTCTRKRSSTIETSELKKSNTEKENNASKNSLLIGVALILISNITYLGNNYVIKWGELQATEISMVRGIFQILMFAGLFYRERRYADETTKQFTPTPLIIGQLLFFGFLMATLTFSCLAAIPLMPIGDLIVLTFTSPAFTVFISRIMIKTRLTMLGVMLSFCMVVGSILVVQPPFIFGSTTQQNEIVPELNNTDFLELPSPLLTGEISINQTRRLDEIFLSETEAESKRIDYYIGVGLCIYVAIIAAVVTILSTKLSSIGVSNNLLMMSSGFFELILSFVFLPLLSNRLVTGDGLSLRSSLMLPLSVVLTTVAFWFITLALDKTRDPTLISMLRASEILFSFVTESIYHQKLPEPLSVIGSSIVLVCVLMMTVRDKLEGWCLKLIGKEPSNSDDQIIEKI